MKQLLTVLLVSMTMISCSTDECNKWMSKCDDSVGKCVGEPIEMPCNTKDGYVKDGYTYRNIETLNK